MRESSQLDRYPRPVDAAETPAAALQRALALDGEGAIEAAIETYRVAVASAERLGDHLTLAQALRRLAVLLHHANQSAEAQALAERSRDVAMAAGDSLRAAEAVNVLAGFALEHGELDAAEAKFGEAAALGAGEPAFLGRVAQNLGIIASVRGAWDDARAHYQQALASFEAGGDEQRVALSYHNLGLVSSDRGDWGDAERNLETADLAAIAIRAFGGSAASATSAASFCATAAASAQAPRRASASGA